MGASADPRARPLADIKLDIRNRFPYYFDDWRSSWKHGLGILAPATYVFFASIISGVSFGEQLAQNTEGELTAVHVVFTNAISGIIQTFIGGQPLAIMLAQQPIVTIISFQFNFIKEWDGLDRSTFLPWVAWTGVFAALFLILMSIFGVCRFIYRYTRLSEETFGMLIAVLFLQQAVMGMISEFRRASRYARAGGVRGNMQGPDVFRREDEDLAILCNGLWALILFVGMASTSLMVDRAREWRFGTLMLRALLADYGVPLMVVVWTSLSYALQSNGNNRNIPSAIPRRVTTPFLWQVTETWHVAKRMADLPGPLIASALVPAIIIAILFWFDHGVSIKLGMPKELNLQKPAAFAWDQLVLSVAMIVTALLGCPVPNAAIPQSPMHTYALSRMSMHAETDDRRQARKEARVKRRSTAFSSGLITGLDLNSAPLDPAMKFQTFPFKESGRPTDAPCSAAGAGTHQVIARYFSSQSPAITNAADAEDEEEEVEPPAPMVAEQRLSNLIQSIMLAICLPLMHVIQLIPTAVIWGYFAYMAITSFDGKQFWERMTLVFTDRKHYYALLHKGNADYLKIVPYPIILLFTAFQFGWLAGLWALVTWAGVAGVAFPVPIVALVPIRLYVLPYFFKSEYLEAMDPLESSFSPPDRPRRIHKEEIDCQVQPQA